MKLVLFAFEAFGPWEENSTEEVTDAVAQRLSTKGIVVCREVLPVVLSRAPSRVGVVLEREQPDAVLATGLAGNRPFIDVEQVAVNEATFRIRDNDGVQACGELLEPAGPDELVAAVDVHGLREAIAAAGAPARVSRDAGRFLCNAVHYSLLNYCGPRGVPGMFLHLPPEPEAARKVADREPSEASTAAAMALDQQVAGVEAAAHFLLRAAGHGSE